jgi:hypothetical protein
MPFRWEGKQLLKKGVLHRLALIERTPGIG